MKKNKKEKPHRKKKTGVLKRMLRDVSKIRRQLVGVVIMALVIIACNLLSPQILGGIIGSINDFLKAPSDGGSFVRGLVGPLCALAAIYVVYSFFSWLKMYTLNNVVSRRFTCELRIVMADKISRLPVSYLDRTKTGEILARVNNNVSMMGNSIHEALDVLLMGVLQLAAIAVMLFYENWQMALAVVLLVPLSTVISTVLAKKSMRYYDKMWQSYEDIYSCVEEDYGGIETVKSYNMEETMRKKHALINDRLTDVNKRAVFLSSAVQPVVAFTNHASFIAVCLLGGILAVSGKIAVATVVTVILYSKNFSGPLMQIANGLSSIQHVGSAAKKVYGFLDEAEMTVEEPRLPERVEGNVEFKDVEFSYTEEKPLIERLSFSVRAGQKAAIVGPTGAGKTTIVNLLMRFYTNYTESFDTSVGDWYARYSTTDSEEAGVETKVSISSEAHSGAGALLMDGRVKPWNSAGIDLTNVVTEGATYKLTFWAKVPDGFDDWEDGINMRVSGAYKMEEDSEEKYENYPADTDYFVAYDEWSYHEVEFVVPSALYSYIFYFETNGSGKCPYLIDDVTLVRTSSPRPFDPTLPSIKETYATVGFDTLGTAVSYDQLLNENVLGFVKHHYNSITLGNQMKPDAIISKDIVPTTDESVADYIINDTYATRDANKDADGNVVIPKIDFTYIDKCMKLAAENGLKIRYHTFVWHQQMPKHFFTEGYSTADDAVVVTDQATILDREEMFIRTVMNHMMNSEYADVIYTVDVVNEYTHMDNISAAVGSDNWWRYSFGEEFKTDSEYVKKAFVWAYDELVKAGRQDKVSLVYNDYSTYMPGTKEKIIELVNNINTVDDINTVGKICAGVGMQAHLAETAATAEVFRETIDAFAAADFEIQITELDITNTGEVVGTTSAEDKAEVWEANGELYGQIMTEIIDAKANGANITGVTIWGITDATSWREDRAPVLFGSDLADVKPSFYAVINAALNYGK